MAERGSNYSPHPLDFELLRRMPSEGATLGWHTLALTVSYVTPELNKTQPKEAPKLTSDMVSGRLRAMEAAGYVTTATLIGGGGKNVGWQRTPAGEAFYEEKTGKVLGETPPALSLVEGGQQS